MKQTFKKPSYYLLSQAMDGDEKAIEKILAFYDPYISKCCLRPLYDEYGNVYIVVDMFSSVCSIIRKDKARCENKKRGFFRKEWFSWQLVEKTQKEEN